MSEKIRASLIVAVLVCLAGSVLGQKFGQVSEEEWSTSAPLSYPEANAVVLFDKGTIEVTTDAISILRHVRIKILTQAGVDEAADVEIAYWDDDKLKEFKAHTITPDGKKHKLGRRDFHTKKSGSRRYRVFAFPAVEPGAILEYRYRNVNTRYGLLDPWFFQGELYTLHSELNLELASGFVYSSSANNLGSAASPRKELDKATDMTRYTWIRKNQLPLRDEPYAGSIRNYASALYYQLVSYNGGAYPVEFVKGWPDLGTAFFEHPIEPYLKTGGQVDQVVSSVTSESQSETETLESLYRYVCDSIKQRYEPGTGWFIHEDVGQLLTEAYGSGDEKNLLLTELCRHAGLEAWPVLICSRDHGRFNPEIYQLHQFDHMIAYVEISQGGIFLDASSSFCPFGVLPPDCCVDGGFLVDRENSQVVRVVSQDPRTYRMDQTTIELDSSGTARCSTTVLLSGYFAIEYGAEYELSEESEFFAENFVEPLGVACELISSDLQRDEENNRCIVTLGWTSDELVEMVDNHLIVKQPACDLARNPFVEARRFFPIDFGYPFTHHSIVQIDAGTDASCKEPMEAIAVSGPGIDLTRQCRVEGQYTTIETRVVVSEPLFEPGAYEGIKAMFGEIESAYAEELVLSSSL